MPRARRSGCSLRASSNNNICAFFYGARGYSYTRAARAALIIIMEARVRGDEEEEAQQPLMREDDDAGAKEDEAVSWAQAAFLAVLMLGALTLWTIMCVLLAETRTDAVTRACGAGVWWLLMVRVLFGWFGLVLACAVMWAPGASGDGEGTDDETGLSWLFGRGAMGRWLERGARFLAHFAFAFASAVLLPAAAGDGRCTAALSAASFTGATTLLTIGWMLLALDGVGALVYGGLLLREHRRRRRARMG